MNNIKSQILSDIESNNEIFKRVSDEQYRIRCPLCGDSMKNPTSAHMYLRCSYNYNEPILYHCFKCNSSGKVDNKFLKKLGIAKYDVDELNNSIFNKVSISKTNVDMITGMVDMASYQVKYIESRIGPGLTIDDYDKFKIVWDMDNVSKFVTTQKVKNTLPNNNVSISFLSDRKTSIISRSFYDDGFRWRKIKIMNDDAPVLYTVKATLDVFSKDELVVNIAEGIIDIISIYKNFTSTNSVNIAVLGSEYEAGINYAINNGIIGTNVSVNIYIDNDINEKIIIEQLKKFKWLFKSLTVHKNIKSHDYGVKKDEIKLIQYNI